jgi:hypothetical protein
VSWNRILMVLQGKEAVGNCNGGHVDLFIALGIAAAQLEIAAVVDCELWNELLDIFPENVSSLGT